MRFHTEYLKFQTKQHREFINITGEVTAALKKSGIREGMILVSAMHITAGVWVKLIKNGSGVHLGAAESCHVMPHPFEGLLVVLAGAGCVAEDAGIESAVAGE